MKEKIEEIVNKIKNDKNFMEKFKSNPVSAVEEVLGVDLPEDQITNIINTVKTKIDLDNLNVMDKLKNLF